MAKVPFTDGTRVLTSDGQVVGTVEVDSDQQTASRPSILVRHDGRLLEIPHSMVDSDKSNADEIVLTEGFALPSEQGEDDRLTIQARAEQLNVHVTEQDQGKVRIEKRVEHYPVAEDVELGTHMLDVEHVPSGEEFDEVPQTWYDGDTLVIPVVEEVLVVVRKYRVVENVRISRRLEVRTERVEAELSREVISFHEEDAEGNPIEPES